MNVEGYELTKSADGETFDFIDEVGPGLRVPMAVQYTLIPGRPNVYNLAFGVATYTNGLLELDDMVVTNRGAIREVMATVAHTLHLFWSQHPQALVFITGSDDRRTLLYHRLLSNYGEEIDDRVTIFGLAAGIVEPLQDHIKKSYEAFILAPNR